MNDNIILKLNDSYMDLQSASFIYLDEIADYLLNFRRKRILTQRDYFILKDRFVFRKSLEELGRKYGVTRERIRQLEEKALNKISPITLTKIK